MEIPETSPEHILYAAECAELRDGHLPLDILAGYLNTPEEHARRALDGALLLGLLDETDVGDQYLPHPLVGLLLSVRAQKKPIVFRVFLNDFEPFKVYKRKLATGTLSGTAARHVRITFDVELSSTLLERTFLDWGSFAGIISDTDEGPAVVASDVGLPRFTEALTEGLDDEEGARAWVDSTLGAGFSARIPDNIAERLALGVLRCARNEEARAAAQPIGIAIEDYLRFFADRVGLDHSNRTGTGSMLGLLRDADALEPKQLGLGNALNQIRIACEHGEDRDAGVEWHVELETIEVMVRIALRFIRSCERYYDGDYAL